jgi:hypothetical protein
MWCDNVKDDFKKKMILICFWVKKIWKTIANKLLNTQDTVWSLINVPLIPVVFILFLNLSHANNVQCCPSKWFRWEGKALLPTTLIKTLRAWCGSMYLVLRLSWLMHELEIISCEGLMGYAIAHWTCISEFKISINLYKLACL